jgi:hypothetical protein
VDYYFRSALHDLIRVGRSGASARPIRQVGPHLFLTDQTAVLVRHCTPRELSVMEKVRSARRTFYLLDDGVGGELDADLPRDYRRRLVDFRTRTLARILPLSDTVVVPNPNIAADIAARNVELLLPAMVAPLRPLGHFVRPVCINLVVTGSRSHRADIAMIAPALRRAAESNPRLRIMTYLGRHAPEPLLGHPRILNARPLPWPLFQREYERLAFHIAVCPHRQSPFNACRSSTKILEHASFGAAGLYSARLPHAQWIEHGANGLLVEDDPSQWEEAIAMLCSDLEKAEAIARGGARLAAAIGAPDRVRSFWLSRIVA